MKNTYLLWVHLWLLACACSAQDLTRLATDQRLFILSEIDFRREYMQDLPFKWTSKQHNSARLTGDKVRAFGLPVTEALVLFKKRQLEEVKLSIYTRGDVGVLPKTEFDRVAGKAHELISKVVQSKPKRSRSSLNDGLNISAWRHKAQVLRLEVSHSMRDDKFIPEFIQLRVLKYQRGKTLQSHGETKHLTNMRKIKDRIKRLDNGDVYFSNVPMIDQGDKGYCACAATARILQFYGRTIDQHKLAKYTQTTRLGTDPATLLRTLKSLQTDLNFKLKIIRDWDENEFFRFIEDYNQEAERISWPQIQLNKQYYKVDAIYRSMHLKVLRATIKRKRNSLSNFREELEDSLEVGTPMLWSVMLGVVKEKSLQQQFGGHMRLIVGYNEKTDEVLYSDTWGKGHELKRMSVLDAFAITTGLYAIRAY